MNNMNKWLENYADLILTRGVGLRKGQILVVEETSVTAVEFLRILAERAYKLGAKDVVIHFSDQELTRIRLENASMETLRSTPDWWVDARAGYADKDACFLRLNNDSPDGLAGIDDERIAAWKAATTVPLKEFSFIKKDNKVKWSASAIPGTKWAKKVFPALSEEEAVEALWRALFKSCYVTEESGTDGWDKHIREMTENVAKLNRLNIRTLHFTNSLGTDITMDICDDASFAGGICHCPEPDGELFAPNIPTEEILTTPHRFKVNGTVYSSMPFVHVGNIVDGMMLRFENGKVVEYDAEVGKDVLQGILETDEGARYLGEVALVPYDSPINQMGVLFYNTLLDENAACHLALGAGYSDMIGGEDRSLEALQKKGLNSSALHVDFMFGTGDLSCEATCSDGRKVMIFRDGKFNL